MKKTDKIKPNDVWKWLIDQGWRISKEAEYYYWKRYVGLTLCCSFATTSLETLPDKVKEHIMRNHPDYRPIVPEEVVGKECWYWRSSSRKGERHHGIVVAMLKNMILVARTAHASTVTASRIGARLDWVDRDNIVFEDPCPPPYEAEDDDWE